MSSKFKVDIFWKIKRQSLHSCCFYIILGNKVHVENLKIVFELPYPVHLGFFIVGEDFCDRHAAAKFVLIQIRIIFYAKQGKVLEAFRHTFLHYPK